MVRETNGYPVAPVFLRFPRPPRSGGRGNRSLGRKKFLKLSIVASNGTSPLAALFHESRRVTFHISTMTEFHQTDAPARRRFPQFGVRGLMLGVLVVALVCSYSAWALRRTSWLCDTGMMGTGWKNSSGEEMRVAAQYAFRFDKLIWVVLYPTAGGEWTSVVRGDGSASWIALPSGKRVHLPGDGQIFEYSGGQLITHDERLDISARDFWRYIDSHPDDFGIDSLKRFIEHPGQATQPYDAPN